MVQLPPGLRMRTQLLADEMLNVAPVAPEMDVELIETG
jgi:hypothetical protein